MKGSLLMIVLVILFTSCSSDNNNEIAKWKKEIVDAEHAFAELAKTDGIPKAFITFAAEDVAVLRNGNLIRGKGELKKSYEKIIPSGNETLTWSPDFVDVSSSGDLGYTYGKYTYSYTDSLGNVQSSEGVFHTVWKRQPDGTWKFVWD